MNTKSDEKHSEAAAGAAADVDSSFPNGLVASSLGISGFTIAIVAGLGAGNDASDVLGRAIVAALGCYLAGFFLSVIAAHVVHEHLSGFRAAHPVPDATPFQSKRSPVTEGGARNVEKRAA